MPNCCNVTAPWFWASVVVSSPIPTTPRMPSRPCSSYLLAKPRACNRREWSATGSTEWRCARRTRPNSPRPGGGGAKWRWQWRTARSPIRVRRWNLPSFGPRSTGNSASCPRSCVPRWCFAISAGSRGRKRRGNSAAPKERSRRDFTAHGSCLPSASRSAASRARPPESARSSRRNSRWRPSLRIWPAQQCWLPSRSRRARHQPRFPLPFKPWLKE